MTGIVVAGMHRSGTSLMARTLSAGGWHPGEQLLTGPGEEYFEDESFVALNRRWLAATVPPGEGHLDWGVSSGGVVDLAGLDDRAGKDQLAAAAAFARRRSGEQSRWVAKDPRASLFLPVWAEATEVRFVIVYRNPWDVVDSAVRLGAEVFCRSPGLARDAWLDHNTRLATFASAYRDRCVVVAAEVLALDPARVWRTLDGAVGLGGDVPADLVDPTKFVRRNDAHAIAGLYRTVYPHHVAVLDELDALADLPRIAATPTRAASLPAPSLPAAGLPGAGGSLPAGTGVQVVIACRDDGDFVVEAIASVDQCGHPAVELTLVDDGSTDGETLRVLDALRSSGRHVVTTPGVGLSAARNLGAATSSTCAVLPLDADNRVRAPLLEAVGAIESGGVDIVHGPWRRFGMATGIVTPPDITLGGLVPRNTVDACALISRDLLERLGGWDAQLPFWEDWELWIGAAAVGARTLRLDDVTFDYLVRPDSLNTTPLADPAARQSTVSLVMAKHAAVFEPMASRLIESVHHFDSAASESDRARRSIAAAHEVLVAQYADLVQRHDQMVEAHGSLEGRAGDLEAAIDQRKGDVVRLAGEVQALRSRRVVRGVDWVASRLRSLSSRRS